MVQTQPKNMRDSIVDAALALLRTAGVKKLSQTQVARAVGIPQGHLTYYFPRKSDLLMAVARRSVETIVTELAGFFASDGWPGADAPMRTKALALLSFLVKDRERTRILLGLVIEAESDHRLRDVLVENTAATRTTLARALGRSLDDPEVDLALATLMGLGLQHLVFAGKRPDDYTDALIARLPERLDTRP